VWNRLSCGIVILFLIVTCYVSYIFMNPNSRLNPFPPPTATSLVALPTYDETLQYSLGTLTATLRPAATSTQEVIETLAAEPSATPEPTSTSTPGPVNAHNPATTPIPTKVLNDPYPFTLQGEPKLLDAATFNPKHGCGWMGIAGQTFDMLNRPLPGLLVQVSGTLGGETLEMISMSGTMVTYGQAGFEIYLADQVIESQGSMLIRLIDDKGKPLSEQFKLNTTSACSQNLVIVNFKQVK
jgi:hypothetical protein